MKKRTRKIFSFIFAALLFVSSIPATAFAAELDANEIPEGAVKHTIQFEIPPTADGSSLYVEPEEPVDPIDPINPIWDHGNYYIEGYSIRNTLPFYIPERYLAYEVSATSWDGYAVSGGFSVSILLGTSTINSDSFPINGVTYKKDYIDIGPGTFRIRLTNHTSTAIIVNLTYYSFS